MGSYLSALSDELVLDFRSVSWLCPLKKLSLGTMGRSVFSINLTSMRASASANCLAYTSPFPVDQKDFPQA